MTHKFEIIEDVPYLDRLPEFVYHYLRKIDPCVKFSLSKDGEKYEGAAFYPIFNSNDYGVFLPLSFFTGHSFDVSDANFKIVFVEPFHFDIMDIYNRIARKANEYNILFTTNKPIDQLFAFWLRIFNYFYYLQDFKTYDVILFDYNYRRVNDYDFHVIMTVNERNNIKVNTNVPQVYIAFEKETDEPFPYKFFFNLCKKEDTDFVEIELPESMFIGNVYYRAHMLNNIVDKISKAVASWVA